MTHGAGRGSSSYGSPMKPAQRTRRTADQLLLVYDGAAASAQMDSDPASAAIAAKTAAMLLIDATCTKRA